MIKIHLPKTKLVWFASFASCMAFYAYTDMCHVIISELAVLSYCAILIIAILTNRRLKYEKKEITMLIVFSLFSFFFGFECSALLSLSWFVSYFLMGIVLFMGGNFRNDPDSELVADQTMQP